MVTRLIFRASAVLFVLYGLAGAPPAGSWIFARAAPPATAPETSPLPGPSNAEKELREAAKTKPAQTAHKMPPLPVRKPKPRPPTTPEGIFRAKLTALLLPALATKLSDPDSQTLIEALKAIKLGKLQTAAKLRDRLNNPAARKLVDWYRLRLGFGRPKDYAAFLSANPAWPDRKTLIARAEDQAFTSGGTSTSIMAYFKQFPPRTAAGHAALASAHLAQNDKITARKLAAQAWRELTLPTTLETGFLQRFAPLLSGADHKWRLNRLLLNDSRYRSTRKRRAGKIRRLIPLLKPAFERTKATARLAVYLRQKRARGLMMVVSAPPPLPLKNPAKSAGGQTGDKPRITTPANADKKDAGPGNTNDNKTKVKSTKDNTRAVTPVDWGLQFQRVQLLRRQKKFTAAAKILLAAPNDPAVLVNPDSWWKEKRAAAYQALGRGDTETAFKLASNPGPISVNPRKDAAFLAGWIAYRLLKDHKAAAEYFAIMRGAADGPLSASKAGYWLARATQSIDPTDAAAARREAASYIHTFYGQLARQTINASDSKIELTVPRFPTKAQASAFNNMDVIKAAVIAQRAGLRLPLRRAFFNHLRYNLADEADMIMLAHLAHALGDTQMSVRIGKTGVVHKQNLYYYAYPVSALPDYNPLRKPPEKALLLGVARQESEFNTTIRSGAGARGILQIMPITARHICSDYKIRCAISRLTTDHTFNTMIGSAYLADRMDDFGGSYILTLSGYNAGPGRTRQWLKRFGDPRDKDFEPLAWIEQIPFTETRTYVTKVLSNIQIYRARLGGGATALRLLDDISRAKAGRVVNKSVANDE